MPDPTPPATLDVFISYAREDRPTAAQLAAALQARSLAVWWDREILGGAEFSEVIEQELNRARVALVLWSADAVRSSFVRDESARALAAGKLLPVRIEDVAPPLGFGQIHTLDLIDWDGEDDAPALAELVAHIQRRLKGGSVPLPARRFVQGLRSRRRALVAGGGAAAAAALGWFGWSEWFARDTERAQALTVDGVEKFEARQFDPARLLFNQALVADDRYAPAFFYRAQVLIQSGAPQEAADDLRAALRLKFGLDGAQLRDAGRWLADLGAGGSDPAPVTRLALAEPAPSPAPPPAAGEPRKRPPEASGSVGDGRPPTAGKVADALKKPPVAAIIKPPPVLAAPPPPPPATVELRSQPLAGAARDKLAAAVEQMFSPRKEARLAATTGLIVDADATSDAVPLAVQRALQVQRGGTPTDAAQLSGVINVLTLLLSATPSTLALHADDIRRLLDSAKGNGPQTSELAASVAAALTRAEKTAPVVYLQIASEAQRALAGALAARLRAGGYRVPAPEVVGARAPSRTEIRVQGRSDQGLARWMAKATADLTAAPVRMTTLRSVKPKEDTFEIWLEAGLCVAGTRQPAACAG